MKFILKHHAALLAGMLSIVLGLSACTPNRETEQPVTVHLLHTTDVHGRVFPNDFLQDEKPLLGSYARVASFVDSMRKAEPNVVLLDAGDILQGQPIAYYYNFIDTLSENVMASVLNYLRYDAVAVGNHEIETGHRVYDTFRKELKMPFLSANSVDTLTGKPYFEPYTIIKSGGKRIAVIGFTTPAVPEFLPESLWSGMRFDDIVETAKKWVPEILKQKPDLIVALIHSGRGDKHHPIRMAEDAGYALAEAVPEISLICAGHDHAVYVDSVMHSNGQKTYLVNPGGPGAENIVDVTLLFGKEDVQIHAKVVSLVNTAPDETFLKQFHKAYLDVKEFVAKPIGSSAKSFSSRDAFFGPSAFVDLIHRVQMGYFPEAEISLSSPLRLDTEVKKGRITMQDLFKLYRFENRIDLLRLKGSEIHDALEASYALWVRTMQVPSEHMLLFASSGGESGTSEQRLQHPFYNFDSAAGICYTVDLRKKVGERVRILSMADGRPFDPQKEYKVVVNSYRGCGGGKLLTEGIGLSLEELQARLIKASVKDVRYYLMKYLQKHDPLHPEAFTCWSFEPKNFRDAAAARDSLLLFSQYD